MTINIEKLCEDEDIVDKLNKISNTHYQIHKPFKKEDLEKNN